LIWLGYIDHSAVSSVGRVDGDVGFGSRTVMHDRAFVEEGFHDRVSDALGAACEGVSSIDGWVSLIWISPVTSTTLFSRLRCIAIVGDSL
jgi:hypothetical protein